MSGYAVWEETLVFGENKTVRTDLVFVGISDRNQAIDQLRKFFDVAPSDDRKFVLKPIDQETLDDWEVREGEIKSVPFFSYEPPAIR